MIYQVYYKEEQRGILEPQFTPYNNAGMLTNYFENSIIALLAKKESDPNEYFGVLSWNLRRKIELMKQFKSPFTNTSKASYSFNWLLEQIEKDEDVIFLMEHNPHSPVFEANKIHPRFAIHWKKMMTLLGIECDVLVSWERVIYCNFFIAKHHIYKRYVDELLIPAMRVMEEQMPELNEDAHYPKGPGYTHHSFICERLFSYWYNFMYKK